ncbi:hypothetical protein PIB30_072327 [Stylosanthes scabra]|uniref:Uncharacterized protein n=1 Tax=Stylosanthes scabra TaxID=79078 RepID=A0ABU6UMX4_9FABA|nr:hypothetical protein [Stylosanthes scabra]
MGGEGRMTHSRRRRVTRPPLPSSFSHRSEKSSSFCGSRRQQSLHKKKKEKETLLFSKPEANHLLSKPSTIGCCYFRCLQSAFRLPCSTSVLPPRLPRGTIFCYIHFPTSSLEAESGFPNKKPRIETPKIDAENGTVAEKLINLVTSELMVHPGECRIWEELNFNLSHDSRSKPVISKSQVINYDIVTLKALKESIPATNY